MYYIRSTLNHNLESLYLEIETKKSNGISALFCISSENDRPPSLTPGLIDYNMPLTTTYLKQMKLQCMNNNEQVRLGCGF